MTEQTAESPKKRRRLWWIVLAIVVLPVWYVGAWLAAAMALSRGYIPNPVGNFLAIPFRPLIAFCNSDVYGSEALTRLFCIAASEQVARIRLPQTVGGMGAAPYSIQFGPLSPNVDGALCQEFNHNLPTPILAPPTDASPASAGTGDR